MSLIRIVFSLAVAACAAQATVITFDAGDPIGGLAVGTVLSNQYAAFGVTFSPNAFSGAGGPTGTWGTNTGMQVVASGGGDVGGLGTPSLVSGNILRSFGDWLNENGDPSILLTFSTPISDFGVDFAGIATPTSTRVFAYNGATQVALVTSTTTTGQQHLSISGVGDITSIKLTPGDFFDWVGVDNISFTQNAGVPEPSTFVLMGIGAIALVLRRRAA